MSQSIVVEAVFAAKCIGVGVMIAVAYDLLRILRNCVRHNRMAISAEDLVYWVLCAFFIFAVLYCENDGILRWYCVAGAALGMFVYEKTLSPYFVHIMSTVVQKTIYLVARGVSWILKPLKSLFFGLRKVGAKLCKFFTKRKKRANK